MAAGETFRATVVMEGNTGQAVVYDFGYADVSGSVHIDCGTAAGNFQTLVQAAILLVSVDTITPIRYRFACVGGTHVGEVGFVEVTSGVTGALASSDMLPLEICISLKRNTGHSSRRDRGRVFFGPVSASLRDAGNSDKVDRTNTDLQALRDKLKATLTVGGATLQPVILAANGSYSGRTIVNVSIGEIFTHHKSRRLRVLA